MTPVCRTKYEWCKKQRPGGMTCPKRVCLTQDWRTKLYIGVIAKAGTHLDPVGLQCNALLSVVRGAVELAQVSVASGAVGVEDL
eukprot:6050599-Pyramimonas_sp.AAC.1